MKLHFLTPVIIIAVLVGLLSGCTASRQTAAPSIPLAVAAAEETVSAQPVLTAVTTGGADIHCDERNDAANSICSRCGTYGCDGGIHCGTQEHESANSYIQESGKNYTPCSSCGEYDCSGGTSCTVQSTHCPEGDQHGGHHNRHH